MWPQRRGAGAQRSPLRSLTLLTFIGNFLIYFLVTLAIVMLSGRQYIARDKRLAGFVGALLILLPAGQAGWHSRTTYPFVPWDMYASSTPPQTYQEYLIQDDVGPAYHYPFGHVAFSSPRAFMRRLDQLVRACRCTGGDALVDAVIEALGDIHRDRTGRTITQFEVYDVQIATGSQQTGPRTLRYTWGASAEVQHEQS